MNKKDFLEIYKRLSTLERRQVVCVIDDQPCSWSVVDLEVRGNTEMSKRMLKQISNILDYPQMLGELKEKEKGAGKNGQL